MTSIENEFVRELRRLLRDHDVELVDDGDGPVFEDASGSIYLTIENLIMEDVL